MSKKKLYIAIVVIALAIIFAIISIPLPSSYAAKKNALSASTTIAFKKTSQIVTEINNGDTGLQCSENADGTITMNPTEVSIGTTTKKENIVAQHKSLVESGILRYAIYSGSLCSQARGSQLLIILDFQHYNISELQAGFLSGLTYALLGSNERGGSGCKLTVKNVKEAEGDEVSLTVYDSANGGKVIDDKKYVLTLQGIYENDGAIKYDNSTVSIDGGTPTEITNYSIRIVLPSSQSGAIKLLKDSLTVEGAKLLGIEIGTPKQPDCIGLGISHLHLTHGHHEDSIQIESGAATCTHFHWMTVSQEQMAFSYFRMLDNVLDTAHKIDYADEIFKKPNENSDFSHLYISSKKTGESSAKINVLDTPSGELTENGEGKARSVRLLYAYNYYLNKNGLASMDVTFKHYRRTADNKIQEDESKVGTLTYEQVTTYPDFPEAPTAGEKVYAVKCSHEESFGSVIGYFTDGGKQYAYDENDNLFDASKE